MGFIAALLMGLLMSGMGGQAMQALWTGPEMGKIEMKKQRAQHGFEKESMAMLSAQNLAREKELLGRQEQVMGKQRQASLQDTMLNMMGQQQMMGQQSRASVLQSAMGALSAPQPPRANPGMGMVDMLRMQ